MNSAGILTFGKTDGLRIFAETNIENELLTSESNLLLKLIQLRLEDIRLTPGGEIISCRKYHTDEHFYIFFIKYNYVVDYYNRDGYYGSSIVLKDSFLDAEIIHELLVQLNQELSSHITQENKIEKNVPQQISEHHLKNLAPLLKIYHLGKDDLKIDKNEERFIQIDRAPNNFSERRFIQAALFNIKLIKFDRLYIFSRGVEVLNKNRILEMSSQILDEEIDIPRLSVGNRDAVGIDKPFKETFKDDKSFVQRSPLPTVVDTPSKKSNIHTIRRRLYLFVSTSFGRLIALLRLLRQKLHSFSAQQPDDNTTNRAKPIRTKMGEFDKSIDEQGLKDKVSKLDMQFQALSEYVQELDTHLNAVDTEIEDLKSSVQQVNAYLQSKAIDDHKQSKSVGKTSNAKRKSLVNTKQGLFWLTMILIPILVILYTLTNSSFPRIKDLLNKTAAILPNSQKHDTNIQPSSAEKQDTDSLKKYDYIYSQVDEYLKKNYYDQSTSSNLIVKLKNVLNETFDLTTVSRVQTYIDELEKRRRLYEEQSKTVEEITDYVKEGKMHQTYGISEYSHIKIDSQIDRLYKLTYIGRNVTEYLYNDLAQLKQEYYSAGYSMWLYEAQIIEVTAGTEVDAIARMVVDQKNGFNFVKQQIIRHNPKDIKEGRVINGNARIVIYKLR